MKRLLATLAVSSALVMATPAFAVTSSTESDSLGLTDAGSIFNTYVFQTSLTTANFWTALSSLFTSYATTLGSDTAAASAVADVFETYAGVTNLVGTTVSIVGTANQALGALQFGTDYLKFAGLETTPSTPGNTVGVPGPIAAAGLPAVLGLMGFAAWRRRQAANTNAAAAA